MAAQSYDGSVWAFGQHTGLGRESTHCSGEGVKQYNEYRDIIAGGVQFHLLPQSNLTEPDIAPLKEPDAFEFYDPKTDRAVAFVFQGNVPWSQRQLMLRGLRPDAMYRLVSADGAITLQRTGTQLMNKIIDFPYAPDHPSTLLLVTPMTVAAQ